MGTVQDTVDEGWKYAVRLDRFERQQRMQVEGHLIELQNDLRLKILELDVPGQPPSRQEQRLRALLQQVEAMIEEAYENITTEVQSDLRELSSISSRQGAKLINVALKVNVAQPVLVAEDLKVLSQDPIVRGRPSSDWWKGQSESLQNKFAAEMRLGLAEGQTNDQLVNRIIGSAGKRTRIVDPKTGKTRYAVEYNGGIMDATRRDAMALVRTSAQTVSNESLMLTYKKNSRLLRGVGALVTLDGRTTVICMSLSGGAWDVETGEPLPESTRTESMPPPPPFHWQCRTIFMPITKSWDDLRKARGKDRLPAADRRKLDTVPNSERQSIDGKVPGTTSFGQWLKKQDKTEQVAQIGGVGKWKLWNEGKITLDQLTNAQREPLTLKQLRELAA